MSLKKKKDLKQLLKIAEQRKFPKINPEQKLSLCLITKNEEKNIARCLESVQGVVDEIILLDTGSTDKTVEIAKNYNAKVFYSEWKNDFAQARNESIEKATGDWILVLDADEELKEESKGQIRVFMVETEEPICYTVRIKNYNEKKEIQISNFMTRLFKNDPTLRFQGKIHEAIQLGHRIMLAEENVYILHHGYTDANRNIEKHEQRNNPIIENLFNQEGISNDYKSYLGFYIGSEKVASKDYDAAIKEFEQAISIANIEREDQNEFNVHLYLQLIITYILNSNYDKARELLNKSVKDLPKIVNTYEYWSNLGELDLIDEKYQSSYDNYMKAIELFDNKELNYFRVVNDPFYYYLSLYGVIQCSIKLNIIDKAIERLDSTFKILKNKTSTSSDYLSLSYLYTYCNENEKALEAMLLGEELAVDENKETLQKYISNFYLRLNRFYDAIMVQAKMHDKDLVKDHWYAMAKSLEDEKQFQFAEQVYSAIIDVLPDEVQSYLGRAVSYLVQNKSLKALEDLANAKKYAISIEDRIKLAMLYFQIGQAYQSKLLLEDILKESPEHYEANLYKASLEQSEGSIETAQKTLLKIIDLYPEDNRAIVQLGNLLLANNHNDEAIEYYNKALEKDSNNAYIPYALALCCLNKGDKEKASDYLNKALEIDPQDEGLLQIKQQLQLA